MPLMELIVIFCLCPYIEYQSRRLSASTSKHFDSFCRNSDIVTAKSQQNISNEMKQKFIIH